MSCWAARSLSPAAAPRHRTSRNIGRTIDKLAHRNEMTNEAIVENSFFDGDPYIFLTTASLTALTDLYPTGYFDARRFRPIS